MRGALLLGEKPEMIRMVYGSGRREALAAVTRLFPEILCAQDLLSRQEELREIEVVFSTWGMPKLTQEQLSCLPALKAVFYAAGTVKPFADPLLKKGITVVSAASANAVSVAEMATSEILLGLKGFFRNIRDAKDSRKRLAKQCFAGPGIYGEKVAILGCGQIGRNVICLLRNHTVDLLLYDPFLSAEEARSLGGRKVSLAEAFQEAFIVSNHMPNLPETAGCITKEMISMMRPNAVFVNTGRGATVDEAGMCEVLQQRPDLTAVLDVTFPEPPAADSPLYWLENVCMTSHIAGAVHDETCRMADLMLEEYALWDGGKKLRFEVTEEMLHKIA